MKRLGAIVSALGVNVGVGAGMVILGVVFLLALVVGVYLLFRAWASLTERGRRRLELMGLWLRRAVAATTAHAAQVNTGRVVRAWTDLLTRVPGRGEAALSGPLDTEAE